MVTCTLRIGQRLVLQANGGPPEAEFALFDPGEIELQATAPGVVREVGYRTTAEDALRRLNAAGVTIALALDAAGAMIPSLAVTYARGPAVRRVAPLLGPCELFEGAIYDAELRRYEGRWLDLPALALDLEISRATTLMQALHLMALLQEVPSSAVIALTTREYAMDRRPGERTHRRVALEHAATLPEALRAIAARVRATPPPERDAGPTRKDLLESLRERGEICSDPQAQERIRAMEGAMAIRERPTRGPLSDPDLWALEEQLSAGSAAGVMEALDAVEKAKGRHPATAYLRARASLLSGRDAPRVIAERASALAMSMTSFAELELLAAEAWSAAGELRRAVPFARDLVDNRHAHEELRARASQIIDAADRQGQLGTAPPPPAMQPSERSDSRRPATSPVPAAIPRDDDSSRENARISPSPFPPARNPDTDLTVPARPTPSSFPSDPPRFPSHRRTLPPPRMTPPPPVAGGSREPPARTPLPAVLSAPPPPLYNEPKPNRGTLTGPPPMRPPSSMPEQRRRAEPSASPRHRMGPASSEPRRPSAWPIEGLEERTPPPKPKASATPRRSATPVTPPRATNWLNADLMRGASQPPFRVDSPSAHVHIPKAPPVPHNADRPELAQDLALPPGLSGQAGPIEMLPSSVIEARVQFTFLSRELGREYRNERGIELRADVTGIEAMQGQLLERYPGKRIGDIHEALDVRRHGAFLSEILARTLGAFWVDIAPADLGYWAMVVPPDTRLWPFGRILRLIAMHHKERDLVSYYLELRARTKSS
jgi:hypothetical protein